jgi:hypothetical protein
MLPDIILAKFAFLVVLLILPYELHYVAGVITYMACGLLSLVLGCLSFIWTPRDLLLTEVGIASPVSLRQNVSFAMLTCDWNGYFRDTEAEDEEGLSGLRMVG